MLHGGKHGPYPSFFEKCCSHQIQDKLKKNLNGAFCHFKHLIYFLCFVIDKMWVYGICKSMHSVFIQCPNQCEFINIKLCFKIKVSVWVWMLIICKLNAIYLFFLSALSKKKIKFIAARVYQKNNDTDALTGPF